MTYDHMVTTLRDELLRGGEHRRRQERRRRGAALGAVVAAAALVVASAAWRSDGDQDEQVAGGPSWPAVVAACDALIDARLSDTLRGEQAADFERFARSAVESGDSVLEPLGRELIKRPGDMASGDAAINAHNEGVARCRGLGSPDYSYTYVAAPLGPEPTVALESYGEVVPFGPFDPAADVNSTFKSSVIGHDLSPVEVAQSGDRTFVARWSYEMRDGIRRYCSFFSSAGADGSGPNISGAGCGHRDPDPLEPPTVVQTLNESKTAALLKVRPDVAFVVIQAGEDTYVQRPAVNLVAVPFPIPLAEDVSWTARAYDVAGRELGCSWSLVDC